MKQSAAILALFLGATSAVQLRAFGDDAKEKAPAPAPPEKVHNLLPTHAQDLSNNLDSAYPTFPQPIGLGAGRTAFYAQTEKNQGPVGTGDNAPRTDIQSVAGPAVTDQIGASVHRAAMEGGDATPNRRDVLGGHPASFNPNAPVAPAVATATPAAATTPAPTTAATPAAATTPAAAAPATPAPAATPAPTAATPAPAAATPAPAATPAAAAQSLAQDDSQQHDKRIGIAGYNPWVYQFSYEAMPPTNGWRSTGPGAKYGWHPSNTYPNEAPHGSFGSDTVNPPAGGPGGVPAKKEAPMAEEAPEAAKDAKAEAPPAEDAKAPAAKDAKAPAAEGAKAEAPAADAKAEAPPAKDAKAPAAAAAPEAPPAALFQKKHKSHHKHHHHHKAMDIGDNGINGSVHGFASADKSVLPQPWRRSQVAYPSNGFKNPSFQWLDKPALVETKHHHHHHHRAQDIGDNGIDAAVHGFASADKSVLPKPWRRAKEPYPQNGFKNPSWQWLDKPALVQKYDMKADIGDKKIAADVHGFASNDSSVLPTPYPREEHANNGVLNPTFQHLAHKQDIGNSKYVRPDVYHFVNENIGQVPTFRRRTAPKHVFEAGKSGQGIDIVSTGPSSAKGSLAQVYGDAEGEGEEKAAPRAPAPEKVVVLQPAEYQHRANTNTPNLRTTFYAQQE